MADEYEVFCWVKRSGLPRILQRCNCLCWWGDEFEIEENNDHDKYAVAVKNEHGQIVGHVPIEAYWAFSKLVNKFPCDYGELETECITVYWEFV